MFQLFSVGYSSQYEIQSGSVDFDLFRQKEEHKRKRSKKEKKSKKHKKKHKKHKTEDKTKDRHAVAKPVVGPVPSSSNVKLPKGLKKSDLLKMGSCFLCVFN